MTISAIEEIFSRDQDFYRTSRVGFNPARLNTRFDIFMRPVRDEFRGARVLDLGCHNGRWSYAALRLGASHVTGVDVDGESVEAARSTLGREFPGASVELVVGDVLKFLADCRDSFDVILCLGILYHLTRQNEMLEACRRLTNGLLIVDTSIAVVRDPDALQSEISMPRGLEKLIGPSLRRSMLAVVTRRESGVWESLPTRQLIEAWIEGAGFSAERLVVDPERHRGGGDDYLDGLRASYHCR